MAQPANAASDSKLQKELAFPEATNYVAERVLGRGAFGVVYEATFIPTQQKVAIKKVPNVLEDTDSARRVLRELTIMRHLKHPNVLSLQHVFRGKTKRVNDLYIVCEYMHSDLHRIVQSSQVLTAEHIQFLMYQLMSGLDYLHRAGVLHRDLKPGNVLVKTDCSLKICDFGLARFQLRPRGSRKGDATMTEHVVTRWYRAPEVILSSGRYTQSVDIWSAGCIFAELLARNPLFPGKNYLDMLHRICDVLGKPDYSIIRKFKNAKARKFLRSLPAKCAVPLDTLFPFASEDALDLLKKMLVFDRDGRLSAAECLQHPYFASIYNTNDYIPAPAPPSTPSTANLRQLQSVLKAAAASAEALGDDVKSVDHSLPSTTPHVLNGKLYAPLLLPAAQDIDLTFEAQNLNRKTLALLLERELRLSALPSTASSPARTTASSQQTSSPRPLPNSDGNNHSLTYSLSPKAASESSTVASGKPVVVAASSGDVARGGSPQKPRKGPLVRSSSHHSVVSQPTERQARAGAVHDAATVQQLLDMVTRKHAPTASQHAVVIGKGHVQPQTHLELARQVRERAAAGLQRAKDAHRQDAIAIPRTMRASAARGGAVGTSSRPGRAAVAMHAEAVAELLSSRDSPSAFSGGTAGGGAPTGAVAELLDERVQPSKAIGFGVSMAHGQPMGFYSGDSANVPAFVRSSLSKTAAPPRPSRRRQNAPVACNIAQQPSVQVAHRVRHRAANPFPAHLYTQPSRFAGRRSGSAVKVRTHNTTTGKAKHSRAEPTGLERSAATLRSLAHSTASLATRGVARARPARKTPGSRKSRPASAYLTAGTATRTRSASASRRRRRLPRASGAVYAKGVLPRKSRGASTRSSSARHGRFSTRGRRRVKVSRM